MIEGFEDGYLVRVRAQVMSRDDSSGGWVPLGGGGLSNVSVRKRPRQAVASTVVTAAPGGQQPVQQQQQQQQDLVTKPKYDYLIYGIRISDQSIVLSCTIKKDFEYNKVMPTFHHWKTGDKKFGLTFQTAADARAFDKGVRTAIEDLLDGLSDIYPLMNIRKEVGDDEVFMTLNLPQDKDSRSSSDSSAKGTDSLHRIHYISRDKEVAQQQHHHQQISGYSVPKDDRGESYTYVQLRAMHEYIYPMMDDQKQQELIMAGGDSPVSKKATSGGSPTGLELMQQQQPPLPLKPKYMPTSSSSASSVTITKPPGTGHFQQTRCRHCHEFYVEERNARGACEYAPDAFRSAISTVSCIGCAQCLCYHCASDAEGDFAQRPCECARDDEGCGRRWLCLALLSLFVPCLCLYPPLKSCHWCGVRLGWCGGRHNK